MEPEGRVIDTMLGPIRLCAGCYYCARTEAERQRYLLAWREGQHKAAAPGASEGRGDEP